MSTKRKAVEVDSPISDKARRMEEEKATRDRYTKMKLDENKSENEDVDKSNSGMEKNVIVNLDNLSTSFFSPRVKGWSDIRCKRCI